MGIITTVALSVIAVAGSTVQAYMTDALRQKILDDHNNARRTLRAANMREMKYDTKLETVARLYIESTGKFEIHNPRATEMYGRYGGNITDRVGENWWGGGPDNAIWAWLDSKWPWGNVNGCSEREEWIGKYYDGGEDRQAARNSSELSRALYQCRGRNNYLHYSQVMWAETDK
eukprot:Ihof_evm1s1407 gene=Ihof_evmTU1s1407